MYLQFFSAMLTPEKNYIEWRVQTVKHPSPSREWACEAIRLATGEPTRATARLAYPSFGNGAFEGS
jgi:hypothetical protein